MLRFPVFTFLTTALFLAPLTPRQATPPQGSVVDVNGYRVVVGYEPRPRIGASPTVTLSVKDLRAGTETAVVISNYTTHVDRIFVPGPGKLVALGDLGRAVGGGRSMTLIGIGLARPLDTVLAWRVGVSHSGRYAAYEFRYPPDAPAQFRNALLLLDDFGIPPGLLPHVDADDAQKGFILYPEQNRLKGKYLLAATAPPGVCCSAEEYNRIFTSPIAWSQNDKKIAVLEAYEGKGWLVVVDIANGPLLPRVSRWEIDTKPFLKDVYEERLPDEYRHRLWINASRLEFAEGGNAVVFDSEEGGPFAAMTASLSFVDGSVTILTKPTSAPHLEVPPGTDFIRVGGPVQEKKLLQRVEPVFPPGIALPEGGAAVRFEALIDKDGRVEKLLAISGPADLITATEDAVRRWRYEPTALDGRPVPVLTTIDVVFPARRR